MRRLLIAVLGSLLAAALVAPGAQGATQVRHFQGEMSTPLELGGPPTLGPWEVDLDVVFKNKRANKKRFTPRLLTLIHVENAPLRCVTTTTSGRAFLTTTSETPVELKRSWPKTRQYSFTFGYNFTTFTGTIGGRFFKSSQRRRGKHQLQVLGSLKVDHVLPLDILWPPDFDPGDRVTDCFTNGPLDWWVGPCRTPSEGGSLPICRVGGGT